MADITVTTDFSQVNNLKESLQTLPPAYARVVDSVLRENNRLKRLLKMAAKDGADTNKLKEQSDALYTAQLQRDADKRERVRAREAAKAEKEAKRIEAANEKTIASEAKLRAATEKKAAQDKLTLATNKADTAFALGLQRVREEEGQIAQKQAEILRLEVMYNKVAVASKVYEQAEKSLNRAVLLGVLTADQKEAKLAELSIAYQKVGNDANKAQTFINRFGENAQVSGRGLNQFGVYAQQVGYQVGDFLVQIQSGTNFLVAFGQQATQLAGLIPGVLGAALGIGISLATAIGAAFMRTSQQAEESKKGVNTYKDALENLNAVITETSQNLIKLQFGGSETALAENEVKNLKSQVQGLRELLKELRSTQTSGSSTGLQQISAMFSRNAAVEEFKTRKEELRILEDRLQVLEALNEAQRMLNGDLSVAAGIQKGIVYDMEVQLRLAREIKSFSENLAEGVEEPQKKLDIQREYQRLLQAGVKPVEAMAQAQYNVETALNRSKIASGKLTSDQSKTLEATNAVLLSTFVLEDQFRQVAAETELLEQGISQSVIDALKLQGVDLSNLSAGALSAAAMASNLGISLGLATEIERLSKMSPEEKFIRQGVKTGALPREALNSLDGQTGFTTDANAPIEIPGIMTPNPDRPKKDTGGGGGKGDPLEELRQQIKLENELLGVSEAQARVIQALGTDRSKYSQAEINAITAEIEAYNQKQETIERTKEIMDTVKSSMEDAFMSMVDGTKSAKDAFKDMAAEIIKELYRVLVVKQLVNGISGAIGGIFGGSAAPVSSPRPMANPFLQTRASGGPISANTPYLVGEKGPELVIPKEAGTVVNAVQTAKAINSLVGEKKLEPVVPKGFATVVKATEKAKAVDKLVGKPSKDDLGVLFGGARATGGPIESNKAYLVGEKGPELVIPRQSGTVVNAAQTAQAMGKGSGDVTVNNNITVTGSDAAMVRTEIAKMIPQITNATKAAVIDAKQRGGQMAAAFR